jgi:hypothetical protein
MVTPLYAAVWEKWRAAEGYRDPALLLLRAAAAKDGTEMLAELTAAAAAAGVPEGARCMRILTTSAGSQQGTQRGGGAGR